MTCREGKYLEDALELLDYLDVPYDYVNENVPERIKEYGNDCRKVSFDLGIDDKVVPPGDWDALLNYAEFYKICKECE